MYMTSLSQLIVTKQLKTKQCEIIAMKMQKIHLKVGLIIKRKFGYFSSFQKHSLFQTIDRLILLRTLLTSF